MPEPAPTASGLIQVRGGTQRGFKVPSKAQARNTRGSNGIPCSRYLKKIASAQTLEHPEVSPVESVPSTLADEE